MKNAQSQKIAKNVKAVVFDGDGVFFSGSVYIGPQGEAYKERSHIDGQGISLLRAAGVRIAFITAETTPFLKVVADKLNNLPSVKAGTWPQVGFFDGHIANGKVEQIQTWLSEIGVDWKECAYMGDDLGDHKIMEKVGLAAAPSQAEEVIKKISHFVAAREGGKGAIRDLCNFILEAKGIDPKKLALR